MAGNYGGSYNPQPPNNVPFAAAYPSPTYPNAAYGYQAVPPPPPTFGYVTRQPVHHTAAPQQYNERTSDHYFGTAVCLSCCCCLCGTPWALLCTIPAACFAKNAQEAEKQGDYASVAKNRRAALILNTFAVITGIFAWILIIIVFTVQAAVGPTYVPTQ